MQNLSSVAVTMQSVILVIAFLHAILLYLAQLSGWIKDAEQTKSACYELIAFSVLAYVLGTVRT